MSPIVRLLTLGDEIFVEISPFVLEHAWRSAFDVLGDSRPFRPNCPYEKPEQKVLSHAKILSFYARIQMLNPPLSNGPLTSILISKHNTEQKLSNCPPVTFPFLLHNFPDQLVLFFSKFSPLALT